MDFYNLFWSDLPLQQCGLSSMQGRDDHISWCLQFPLCIQEVVTTVGSVEELTLQVLQMELRLVYVWSAVGVAC